MAKPAISSLPRMRRHKNPLEFSCCGPGQLAEMGEVVAIFCQDYLPVAIWLNPKG